MKKILNNRISHLLFLCMVLIITTLISCNNDDSSNGAPVITGVINYAAAPNDTIVDKLVPGQWVVIKGSNLKDAVKIAFNGIAVDFNGGLFSDTYAVVQLPAVIPFPLIAENQLNTIEVVNQNGSTTFSIDIVAGEPTLAGISNENPVEGEEVTIYGTNLFLIEEVVFGGIPITDYIVSDDGTTISFVVSDVTSAGPLKITTGSGVILTPFNVNDVTTGILSNADDIFNWPYWGGANIVNNTNLTDFEGNNSNFFLLNLNNVGSGGGSEWDMAVRINEAQWIPTEDLSDPVANWALKFEINVPVFWSGGTIMIKTSNGNFMARYEPWLISSTKSFKTTGWQTVTIPLTKFLDGGDGKGALASNISAIVGSEGKSECIMYFHNYGTSEISFRAAFDNIRVVKIIDASID